MTKKLILLFLLSAACRTVPAIQPGQPAPACPAELPNQQAAFSPDQYRGKVLLVDFWATWCSPCLQAIPFYNQLNQEKQKDGLEIVAINLNEEKSEALAFLQTHTLNYPVAFNPDGECPKRYEVQVMPSSFLIDKSGVVRFVQPGYHDADRQGIRERINTLLAE